MATPVIMPRQGQSVESCIIGKWHKQVGDKVAVGDILFTYETDKSTFDEEAKVEGTMLAIFFEEGDDVPCLTNVCVIGAEGESVDEFNPNQADAQEEEAQAPAEQAAPEVAPAAAVEAPAPAVREEGERIKISPRAKNLAEKSGVDILSAPATGPNGRIIERDIRAMIDSGMVATGAAAGAYQGLAGSVVGTGIGGRITTADIAAMSAAGTTAAAPAAVADFDAYEEVPNSGIRKTIAKAMHASLSNMAQLTLNTSFDMTEVNAFRAKVKANGAALGLPNITINDIILYAVSRTALNHPTCNAHYFDDKMLLFRHVNLGMAVDTPRGLLVPVVKGADTLSLSQISVAAKAAAEACQNNTIKPDEMKGGTITITNLGTLGIESFTPVINPPQTCILGVNTIETRVKLVGGELKPYQAMTLSLTFDHRALDGAPAARFLKDLVVRLENFTAMLAL